MKNKLIKVVGVGLTAVCIIVLLAVIGYFSYQYVYIDKIYPGVTVAGLNMTGKSYGDAATTLETYKAQLIKTGLEFHYQDTDFTVPITTDGVSLITVDSDTTLHNAFGVGRGTDAGANAQEKIKALLFGTTIPLVYTMDRDSISAQLEAKFNQYETSANDAKLHFADDDTMTVLPDSTGEQFDWQAVLDDATTAITTLQPVNINLNLIPAPAQVTTSAAQSVQAAAAAVVALAPLTFTYEDKSYTVDSGEVATWLTAVNTAAGVVLGLDHDAVAASLATIAGQTDVPVKEGKFSLDQVNGEVKLTQFQDGQDGLGVDVEAVITSIEDIVLAEHESTIPLTVAVAHPRANPDNLEELGIKDLLGTGTTNYGNSPYNRILNIRKGADMLNGLLIAPGEEFSLLTILNPIDLDHGWSSELVIKGDKLEKEAGGGLCQIGSTAFRAAMLSGLDITERRNHSWAISYYSYNGKAGVDATIYDPSPDFKFVNDTGHYILWRSRIEGTNIYFEFWGTSDGRKGSFTTPTNYNYVSAGPAQDTLDPNAAPGSRVCDSHGFTGVTASFDYIIDRANGTQDTKNYTSVYKARPEACIVGPAVASTPVTTTNTTTETNTTVNTNTNTTTNTNSNTNSTTNSNTNTSKKKK